MIHQYMERSKDARIKSFPSNADRHSHNHNINKQTNEMSERFSCSPLIHSVKSVDAKV